MYGFLEHLLHYFNRPHTGLPTRPVGGRTAWMGRDLAKSNEWRERLPPSQVTELQRAVDTALAAKRPTQELSATNFPLPTMQTSIDRWRAELADGRGFLLVNLWIVEESRFPVRVRE